MRARQSMLKKKKERRRKRKKESKKERRILTVSVAKVEPFFVWMFGLAVATEPANQKNKEVRNLHYIFPSVPDRKSVV